MNREDIIKMAHEKFWFDQPAGYFVLTEEDMQCFAKLVAAAEREECARVADKWPDYDVQGLAETIRARGTQ